LIFVSTIAAAYGAWMFDLVVLLVPVVHGASLMIQRASRAPIIAIATLYVLFNLACSLVPTIMMGVANVGVGLQQFIFFTPILLGLWLAAIAAARRNP
jgi:hypothetical protein